MTEDRKTYVVSILFKSGESVEYRVYAYKVTHDGRAGSLTVELEHADDDKLLYLCVGDISAIDASDEAPFSVPFTLS